jgi:hypothetical protein
VNSASPPSSRMIMETTVDKTGLSINRVNIQR